MYTVQLYSVKSTYKPQSPFIPSAPQHFLNQIIFLEVIIKISVTQTSLWWLCNRTGFVPSSPFLTEKEMVKDAVADITGYVSWPYYVCSVMPIQYF
jgi:hypothetical protein